MITKKRVIDFLLHTKQNGGQVLPRRSVYRDLEFRTPV